MAESALSKLKKVVVTQQHDYKSSTELFGQFDANKVAKELDLAKAEAKAWSTIWSAGQGVTNIQDTLSVKDLVSNIKNEFKESLAEQAKLLDKYL